MHLLMSLIKWLSERLKEALECNYVFMAYSERFRVMRV